MGKLDHALVSRVIQGHNAKIASCQGMLKKAKEEVEREVRVILNGLPEQVKQEATEINILQAKMEEFPGGYCRVRKVTPGKCYFTKKVFDDHTEDNIEISETLFDKLIKVGFDLQDKQRMLWNGWDIDILKDGTVIAEFEMAEGQDSVEVPAIFDIKEVKEHTKLLSDNTLSK